VLDQKGAPISRLTGSSPSVTLYRERLLSANHRLRACKSFHAPRQISFRQPIGWARTEPSHSRQAGYATRTQNVTAADFLNPEALAVHAADRKLSVLLIAFRAATRTVNQ
jgi:hypothetical protein